MRNQKDRLAIVSPCYNEEELIKSSVEKLNCILESLIKSGRIDSTSYILLVDDGSIDNTWEIIKLVRNCKFKVSAIRLVNNVGHQNAILAGMQNVCDDVDVIVTIDIDLQDDINAIEKMLDLYFNGAEVVYGIKSNRDADSLAKRFFANMFYHLQEFMGIHVIKNHADFRLLSSSVVSRLNKYSERNLYLRGIFPLISSKNAFLEERIMKRSFGNSKYTLSKMLHLACDGIFAFTTKPIDYVIYFGLGMLCISILSLIYVIISILFNHYTPGWASIMLSIWFVGSVIILSIGIVGKYIGNIYIEVKHRPMYEVECKI